MSACQMPIPEPQPAYQPMEYAQPAYGAGPSGGGYDSGYGSSVPQQVPTTLVPPYVELLLNSHFIAGGAETS